jgi:hypothetical protein
MGTLATALGLIPTVAPNLVGAGSAVASAAPTSCVGVNPISITASWTGYDSIAVSGCGYAGLPITIDVYYFSTVIGQVNGVTAANIPAVTSPPHCVRSATNPSACKILVPETPGGQIQATVNIPPSACSGNPFPTLLSVIAYQDDGGPQSGATAVVNTLAGCAP